jgi:hypothetical protein
MSNFAQDMRVMYAHGLKLPEWNAKTDKERRDLRDTVTQAERFQENQ